MKDQMNRLTVKRPRGAIVVTFRSGKREDGGRERHDCADGELHGAGVLLLWK